VLRTAPFTSTQIVAHRGGPKYAPENTLTAFQNAIAVGVNRLEFDVQMTKDGELVVIHDETVDRTTNGSGAVRELTLAQIRALDVAGGEKIPTFEEVVALAKANGMKILSEAKSTHLYPGIEKKMLKVLEDADYLDRTVILSFEANSLDTFYRLNPNANLCALYRYSLTVGKPPGNAQFVCPMAEMVLLNPFMIRQAHNKGRQVFIWFGLLDNPILSRIMHFFGVDALISDDPIALMEAMKSRGFKSKVDR